MARAIWSGAVSFGLVNVPVKAFTAVRDHEVHFHQLEKKSGAQVRYQKVSEKTGHELESGDIELGYELGRGKLVTIDPHELDQLRPTSTRSIDIADFVDLADIDPIYYERTYWLAPAGETAERPYRLLVAAMVERGRAGIGSVVMRNKQYLAAVRPVGGALAMSTMRFADEVVPSSAVDGIPARASKADAKELRLATQIIDSLSVAWKPDSYHDTYTDELKDLLERRAKGEHVVVEEEPATESNVVDLMAALEASIDAAKKGKPGGRAGAAAKTKPRATKRAPAKKATRSTTHKAVARKSA